MFMNLNTGICNIKKSLKQYNQERSILLFFIQRSTYSNASVESYNFVFNFFNVLEAQSHTPRSIQGSRYTAYMVSYLFSMQCYFCTEKKEGKKDSRGSFRSQISPECLSILFFCFPFHCFYYWQNSSHPHDV